MISRCSVRDRCARGARRRNGSADSSIADREPGAVHSGRDPRHRPRVLGGPLPRVDAAAKRAADSQHRRRSHGARVCSGRHMPGRTSVRIRASVACREDRRQHGATRCGAIVKRKQSRAVASHPCQRRTRAGHRPARRRDVAHQKFGPASTRSAWLRSRRSDLTAGLAASNEVSDAETCDVLPGFARGASDDTRCHACRCIERYSIRRRQLHNVPCFGAGAIHPAARCVGADRLAHGQSGIFRDDEDSVVACSRLHG